MRDDCSYPQIVECNLLQGYNNYCVATPPLHRGVGKASVSLVGAPGVPTHHYLPMICRKISLGTKKSISANKMLRSSALTLRLEHRLLSWDGPQGPLLRQSLFDPSGVCLNEDVIKNLGIWAMRFRSPSWKDIYTSTEFIKRPFH